MGVQRENTPSITAQNRPETPQKHQQSSMSRASPRNFNKTQAVKMQSDPHQPAILLTDVKKEARA
jgi:hypothetical protein